DKGPQQSAETWGEWQTRSGDISIPKIANDEPLRLECEHFLALLRGDGDRTSAAREGLAVVRALEQLARSLERARVRAAGSPRQPWSTRASSSARTSSSATTRSSASSRSWGSARR